jgi:hypothetical protein
MSRTAIQDEIEHLFQRFQEHLKPADGMEALLVRSMAVHYCYAQRATLLQNAALEDPAGIPVRQFETLLNLEAVHQRAYHQARESLDRMQRLRRQSQIGFVSRKPSRTPIILTTKIQ